MRRELRGQRIAYRCGLGRVNRLLYQRIENEELAARRRRTSLFNAISGFLQTLNNLDADGGIVGFAFEDLIGSIAVDWGLHVNSSPGEGQLHIAVSFIWELAKTFVGRQMALCFGIGFPRQSSNDLRFIPAPLTKLLRAIHRFSHVHSDGCANWLF